jgi:cytochrome c
MNRPSWLAACLILPLAVAQAASDPADPAMLKLASGSGCLTCHRIEAAPRGQDEPLPIGPAWSDVAARYQHVPGAADQLLRTVLAGSSPYASHWKGKVSGLAMPPNAVAITEADTHRLVAWILALPKPATAPAAQSPTKH